MSPLSARVSVDLPDPLGPSSSTTSPAAMSNETDAGAGVVSPSWVIASSAHAQQGDAGVLRRPRRGSGVALECGHGTSQQEWTKYLLT